MAANTESVHIKLKTLIMKKKKLYYKFYKMEVMEKLKQKVSNQMLVPGSQLKCVCKIFFNVCL